MDQQTLNAQQIATVEKLIEDQLDSHYIEHFNSWYCLIFVISKKNLASRD
jgi:Ni,Fe-hydrogenase I cytochrome b subunit